MMVVGVWGVDEIVVDLIGLDVLSMSETLTEVEIEIVVDGVEYYEFGQQLVLLVFLYDE